MCQCSHLSETVLLVVVVVVCLFFFVGGGEGESLVLQVGLKLGV